VSVHYLQALPSADPQQDYRHTVNLSTFYTFTNTQYSVYEYCSHTFLAANINEEIATLRCSCHQHHTPLKRTANTQGDKGATYKSD